MAKAKRYDEGGVTEGQNTGIDDDTRARAMKYVQEQADKGDSEESEAPAKSKPTVKAKVETKTETSSKGKDDKPVVRKRTREEVIAAIPTGGKKGAGPTESKGNSASGSELGRNVKNTLAAMGPTRLAGLGNAAAEGVMTARATKAAQAAREAKTLNPNAWMAGPKGMKENFKSGGGVKGWGIARGSRKAKTY
jgi:hypothetical protein